MFDILTYGLSVAFVGIMIVFAALVIIIGLIKVMEMALKGTNGKKSEAPAVKAAAAQEPTAAAPATTNVGGDELIAVISAAIAAVLEAEGVEEPATGFVVRSIRRVNNNAPAWNRAGREEQIYSRM